MLGRYPRVYRSQDIRERYRATVHMKDTAQPSKPTSRVQGASGGFADKMGNKYELSWAVYYALQCIQDERRSITYEELDPELAYGSEFTFVDEDESTHVMQVKRQHGTNNTWTVNALHNRGIFEAAKGHVIADRKYHFGSMTSSVKLRDLSDRARRSDSFDQFIKYQLTKELRSTFDELTALNIFDSPEHAWHILRGMWFEARDEHELTKTNSIIASTMLEGAEGTLLTDAVGSVLLENLRKRLTKRELLKELGKKGITALDIEAKQTAHDKVQAVTMHWRNSIERELLEPSIPRKESHDLIELMNNHCLSLVVGTAGGGKSSVIYQTVKELQSQDAEILAFRLDRHESFRTVDELGTQLGLPDSPVVSLLRAANGRDAFLVIDQLDAVSRASGRMSERYDVIADLIDEVRVFESVKVILVCRLFDIENDHRIRNLAQKNNGVRLTIEPLADDDVIQAVEAMDLDSTNLSSVQLQLLKSPLNLVLLKAIADRPNALEFTTQGSLFDAFWNRKRQTIKDNYPGISFNDTLARVANELSNNQTLSVSKEMLDSGDYINHAEVLASEQILVIDNYRISFFHEMFFDYTFARQWQSQETSLVDFLCSQEQELFRRSQVRQILERLRERDLERFCSEVKQVLLEKKIRFHIKDIVISILANSDTPSDKELDLVFIIDEAHPALGTKIWNQLTRPSWFTVLYNRGLIERWLDSEEAQLRERGVVCLVNAGNDLGDLVAKILAARQNTKDYLELLQQVVLHSEIYRSRCLFDLFLESVRLGSVVLEDSDMWLVASVLSDHKPLWGIELINAVFNNPELLKKNDRGMINFLCLDDYHAINFIRKISKKSPKEFTAVSVPYLLAVMKEAAYPEKQDGLIWDRHFCLRYPEGISHKNIGDVLYESTANALSRLALESPEMVDSLLCELAEDKHDAAQFLLYRALIAGAKNFTDWAFDLIFEGGNRLKCGYASDSHWVSRELIETIAPLISNDKHCVLEGKLRELYIPYEQDEFKHRLTDPRFSHKYYLRSPIGYIAFKFLSALDFNCLSEIGKRRLAEYQRKFGCEKPALSAGITTYIVKSPIAPGAAGKMSNKQWLAAMARYNSDERDWTGPYGSVSELSQVLRKATSEDPQRFAHLALELTSTINPAYPSAILSGFGGAEIPAEAQQTVFDAIRHIAGLGLDECNRWLGFSLQYLLKDVPLDIIEMIRDRALNVGVSGSGDGAQIVSSQGGGRTVRELHLESINTVKGSLITSLGDLLVYDTNGERTAIVEPHLVSLANDPALNVRIAVAYLVTSCISYASSTAYDAFECLIQTEDLVLATDKFINLMIRIGAANPERVTPIINRMLTSNNPEVKNVGGSLAAYAALQWGQSDYMELALTGDKNVRVGIVSVCNDLVNDAEDRRILFETLHTLMHDGDARIRKEVGKIPTRLRKKYISPFKSLLEDLIKSPSYIYAAPQLLFTLREAYDRVDDLINLAVHRFLDIDNSATNQTNIFLANPYASELIVQGLTQSRNKKRTSNLLDILDQLIERGEYGVYQAIEQVERR